MSAPQRIPLSFPVEVKGEKIEELVMRRKKVGDHLIAGKKSKGDLAVEEVVLISNLCEVDTSVIHKLDSFDYERVQRVLMLMGSINVTEIRAAVMTLVGYTGWSLQDCMDLDESDLLDWLKAIPKPGEQ